MRVDTTPLQAQSAHTPPSTANNLVRMAPEGGPRPSPRATKNTRGRRRRRFNVGSIAGFNGRSGFSSRPTHSEAKGGCPMNLRIYRALAVASSLLGCAGAQEAGAPKGVPPQIAAIEIAGREQATTPSCDLPFEPERQVVKPLHLGKCTE
jgi:hypothetical protein